MIGFNGKYLTAAAIGDMRITAMSQGAYDLLGNLSWLAGATRAAILSAFGAEGAGVIDATNAYLNGLATTDRTRAQQLAGFINEDPMLVCSIVETSKTRWLVGDGKAWIKTGYKAVEGLNLDFKFRVLDKSQNDDLFGAYISQNDGCCIFWNLNTQIAINYPASVYTYQPSIGEVVDLSLRGRIATINGNHYQITGNFKNSQDNTFLYCLNTNGSPFRSISKAHIALFNIEGIFHLCPFIRNGECGMIDILTGTFHPNANTEGAFTIALTDKA